MVFPYTLIDLTHTIDENTGTWTGKCGFNHQIILDYQDADSDVKFRVMKFQMDAGIGTHMDAPSHCISGGAAIHDIELSALCMPCIVIDVENKADARYSVTPDDITAFEDTYGVIMQGVCVMIKTGWERFWNTPDRYRNNLIFPSVSSEAAEILIQRDVQILGIDTLSPDRPEEGYKVHQIFLSNGKSLLENVANLNKLPPVGSVLMALPLKVKNATEAPVRLIGMIKR